MNDQATAIPLGWLIDLEFMPAWQAVLIFACFALPILFLGMRSMAGLGNVRKWVAISLRLLVLLVLVLIIGGARWQRQHKNLEVVVLRDISDSTALFRNYPGTSLQDAVDDYLREASQDQHKISRDDRVGVISFASRPMVDSMPSTNLILDSRKIQEGGTGTDVSSAIQLAMAAFNRDAMRRILLISDGNHTGGDLEGAISAAVSQGVPIDVMKLNYNVNNEVLVERVVAPSWKRESDAFDVFVSLLSTNPQAVPGKLTIFEEGKRIDQRPIMVPPATVNADGKIEPRKEVVRVRVPALKSRGVRRFEAQFEPDVHLGRPSAAVAGGVKAPVQSGTPGATGAMVRTAAASGPGDTLLQNNRGSGFTFVSGQGRVLYVDNSKGGAGKLLADTLAREGINIERVSIDQTPEDLVALQAYDAIVLNNVPLGRTPNGNDGLTLKHDAALASYVHDFGGGLVMLGGPDSFGAGGWQGSKIEEVMPLNFDIPAQRQLPKGALVLVMHSCEMPDGNYWGVQCAIKGVEALSSADEIGVISYGWQGNGAGGVGGSVWDYKLAPKGDGSQVKAAIAKMQLGDMPSFDDSLELALNGAGPNQACLKNSNAANKHVIIISDGDPTPPQQKLLDQYKAAKVTISTVSVYPHTSVIPPTMQNIAKATGGRYYGPIEKNPNQLPQIFIKEATVVRRTLIQESKSPPIKVQVAPNTSEIMRNVPPPPDVYGLVLTVKKNNPTIEMPLVATLEKNKVDPLFAHWQAGLGKAAAYTSDASAIWNEPWLTPAYQGAYGKFFAQMVRGVSRPPMSQDFTVVTERNGDKATVTVEATNKESGFANFLNIRAKVVDPDNKQTDVRLVQTGPGVYKAEFNANEAGNYVVAMQYSGPDNQAGWLISGLAVNDSPEMRQLKSNDQLLEEIAQRTKGRVLGSFDAASANLFTRDNVKISSSPLPVWDLLIPVLLALILLDVACRRIAWDWESTKKLAAATAARVRSFTTTRQVEAKPTLDALRKVREEVVETRFRASETSAAPVDASAKFEARDAVEGDITQVVGGATSKAIPAPPKEAKPKGMAGGATGGHTGSLLEAKRRAQQKIREKEQGEG